MRREFSMKSNPTMILQRQYELLARHGALGTLAPLDDLLVSLKPSWCQRLVPVLVPQLADGQAYRRFVIDAHADLAKKDITIGSNIPDDAFYPRDVHGVRFTIDEYSWRRQSDFVAQFEKGEATRLSLFGNILYLLDLCTTHVVSEAVSHPMWSHTVSHQTGVVYPCDSKTPSLFIRSESDSKHQRTLFSRLVVSEEICRTSLAPFYLPDLRMP